ncbi:MAG: phenylalanine--tRNA ligase subunit beta [Oscillospiraceae bacterium]|jgi:phenylalanyl-tRNA synthetase beta chain|nr:phenylalanine--tRNA ligase subunit beta [Oscillospiraceae bacterium]
MDLSMKWLGDYIDVSDMPIKEFCSGLTISGSKVERWETEGGEISKVVVGKILSVVPHENSDHLVVCKVDVGHASPDVLQIVTGASNVHEGDFVPVAMDGSTLPGGVKIKKGKLRGVESNGMLCSLGELGLTTHDFPYAIADGIFIMQQEEDCVPFELGQDIREAIGFDDTSVEFEITSNRPDCMSVIGLARETHATFDRPYTVKKPAYKGIDGDINSMLKVTIHNKELCPRYIAGVVKNVKIGMSPRWMRERLRASGVRPINNFVDITNYVMLEYGHPMHAFDIRYIDNSEINIRNAKEGEKITTLDGTERTLTEKMLVIADTNKPVAVAGVMGGEYSGIMDDTVDVVFEAACFDGASVRTTAKALGMRTDASARFEKGLDPQNAYPALMRAFELVEMLGCGEVVKTIIDADYSDKTPKGVEFDPVWINNFLGADIPEDVMRSCLEKLDFRIENGKAYAPSVRIDIECKADIAEEVARIYGYNNIPKTIIRGVADAKLTEKQKLERKTANAMTALGAYEITTYSFISPKYFDKIRLPMDSTLRKTVVISNPLGEDTSVMRTTLLPSMCEVMARNYNNRNAAVCLFELGSEYIPNGGELPDEPVRLSVGAYGGDMDFYGIKGIVDSMLKNIGVEDFEYSAEMNGFGEAEAFHPGRRAVITKDGKAIGILGELHPETLENYGIGVKAYAAKVNVTELLDIANAVKTYKPLPKFPAAVRDLAIVCDENLPVAELEKAIKRAVGNTLESVTLFDVYKGKQIAEGKKSVAYSIAMRSHEGTLTDEQSDAAVKRVLKELEKLGAELRA